MQIVDSHTGGEPTRVILDGGPDLGTGPMAERARRLADEHPDFCRAVLGEPRGQVAMVGALLQPAEREGSVTGVIFFDVDAVLGMCGHGSIGLGVTLAHLGRIGLGEHRIDTPAGAVSLALEDAQTVTVTNIESRRVHAAHDIDVPGFGTLRGDVAYGGNWFFLVEPSPLPVEAGNIPALTDFSIRVREAANAQGAVGENGELIDHVVLLGGADAPDIHGRNFVLTPDNTYDRSPCGTGCSARLACLAADQRLAPGDEIVQESVIGSRYRLSYQPGANGGVIPRITGQAHVMAESRLIFAAEDPFRAGIALSGGDTSPQAPHG